ncbi:hypothetical protein HGRIS_011320 [Hohenbuehelia grisea]|uniref:Exonuclease 1 n=1 Tax=Hohenbuehelia grisea TaxID=104357 RepID=A0ABR3JVP1_9AGAR
MGISGLLPLLKSIQTTKHLSDFAGQTLAVDAYVWLHRGVFSCATEIATGKKTHKYVDYAMHRVRLLRHYNITPYIVFDGGPLPAKKGTEVERKKRREENLSRANTLAAQGKHSQAREFYVKCVDVTPQMAFQLIKALRAESVAYVVAPYEADAQLAYLERVGLVNGIITEDSDLLVFGCRNVLLKLDDVNSTITHISRADFASVVPTGSDPGGISLLGWSDTQFRHMAILSGCDYLPSIPGIGLKTAWALLKKWRTADNVIRAVRLEGKKCVPKDYTKHFRLAERCFLHQRVYDPRTEQIVHLSDVGDDWDADSDAYVGDNIDPSLAQKIALGDVDPVTLLPMTDINVGYVPRSLKSVPLHTNDTNRPEKGKGKSKQDQTPKAGGILDFFGPKAIIPVTAKPSSSSSRPINANNAIKAGNASGKRTLVEVMDQDIASKKAKREEKARAKMGISKFFTSTASPSSAQRHGPTRSISMPEAGPSRLRDNKENEVIFISDDSDHELGSDFNFSTVAYGEPDEEMLMEVADPESQIVTQEDGYISPQANSGDEDDAPELSSPVCPHKTPRRRRGLPFHAEFGVSPVSSPPVAAKSRHALQPHHLGEPQMVADDDDEVVQSPRVEYARSGKTVQGPDLRSVLRGDASSDIDCFEDDERNGPPRRESGSTEPPTPSPPTPLDTSRVNVLVETDVQLLDVEDLETQSLQLRTEAVAIGWRERWSLGPKSLAADKSSTTPKPMIRRRETTVTKAGRHTPLTTRPRLSAPALGSAAPRREPRRSLVFVQQDQSAGGSAADPDEKGFLDDHDMLQDPQSAPRSVAPAAASRDKLAQFRWGAA